MHIMKCALALAPLLASCTGALAAPLAAAGHRALFAAGLDVTLKMW